MWQDKEPANSKIGYSNKKKPIENNVPQTRPTSSPTYTNVGNNQPETAVKDPYYVPYEEKKNTIIAQVKSKVISQGEATNNRSISFVILENFTLNGETISKGKAYAIGVIKLDENRIFAKINSIKANGKTYNVSGKILGYDGEDGLPLIGSSNSNNSSGTGDIIKDEALRQANRIPIVGGIISKASSGGSSSKTNKISLSGNIECTIVIFK